MNYVVRQVMKSMRYALFGCLLVVAACCSDKCCSPDHEKKQQELIKKEGSVNNSSVTRTATGLGYQILKAAPVDAKSPVKGKKVVVHYTGWLDDQGKEGKKFDSSVDRGYTFSFTIGEGQVIAGWDEGVMAMKIGEKRRLFIPAELGYGSRGAGAAIPPHASLIFDVELFEVKP